MSPLYKYYLLFVISKLRWFLCIIIAW
jgi:hypothetical protein